MHVFFFFILNGRLVLVISFFLYLIVFSDGPCDGLLVFLGNCLKLFNYSIHVLNYLLNMNFLYSDLIVYNSCHCPYN